MNGIFEIFLSVMNKRFFCELAWKKFKTELSKNPEGKLNKTIYVINIHTTWT